MKQRGRHREKISLAAALWLVPARERLRLFWRSLVDAHYNNERIGEFFRARPAFNRRSITVGLICVLFLLKTGSPTPLTSQAHGGRH